MSKLVLVETVSMFRIRYVIELADNDPAEYALDSVVCEQAVEFSQEHLDEVIVSHRVVSQEEALRICDEDNPLYKNWTDERKMQTYFTKKVYNENCN